MKILQDIRDSRTALMGFVVIGMGWATFSAQMPAIKAQIGAGDAAFGTMGLVGAVGAVIAMWLAPFVHRLVGRWAMMVGTLIMT
ncbi:MAG: MFS transporter, partial [Paracoccaceae bacterium]